MENVKKAIPAEKVDKFFKKEFGNIPKGSPLPSELFQSSSASIETKFIEIAQQLYSVTISKDSAGKMLSRFEMSL